MEAIWNTIYGWFGILVSLLSWAAFLALSAKFVFGADFHRILSCFFIGLGINAAVLIFGEFQLLPIAALYTEHERELHRLTIGLITTPAVIAAFGGLYLAFRRLILVGEDSDQSLGDFSDSEAGSAGSMPTKTEG